MATFYFYDLFDDHDFWPLDPFTRPSRRRRAQALQQHQHQHQQQPRGSGGKQPGQGQLARTNGGGQGGGSADIMPAADSPLLTPRLDVREHADRYEVTAELAGVPRENVQVEVHGDTLTIRGEKSESNYGEEKDEQGRIVFHRSERAFGSFERSLRLPQGVDKAALKARSKEGVLYVTVPKISKDTNERVSVPIEE